MCAHVQDKRDRRKPMKHTLALNPPADMAIQEAGEIFNIFSKFGKK